MFWSTTKHSLCRREIVLTGLEGDSLCRREIVNCGSQLYSLGCGLGESL
jgi:hypothetical protein